MSLQELASPAIIGSFYDKLESMDMGWPGLLGGSKANGGRPYRSTQESETYKFLGLSAPLREWIGGRNTKPLWVFGKTVLNKPYEITIPVLEEELRRDKTEQIQERLSEMSARAIEHWEDMLSTLINNGGGSSSGLAFDGQYFFDSDHTWGNNSTSQDNDITVDISAMPASLHGSTTAPSPEEAMWTIIQSVQTMLSFKDNENQPLNSGAKEFLVMVAPTLVGPFTAAVSPVNQYAVQGNVLQSAGWKFNVVANPRLTSATDLCYVFRTDGAGGPFLMQEELSPQMQVLGQGSDHTFKNRELLYGLHCWRGADYGLWYRAVKAQMT